MTTKITGIAMSPSSGDLAAGDVVTVTLTMSGVVTVSSTDSPPTLTLNDGTAVYVSGSGTNSLVFSYTVEAGQNTAALAAMLVNPNDATITDSAGNSVNLSLGGLSQTGPEINTGAAAMSVVASGSGITAAGAGNLGAGSVVTLTVNFNEVVTVAGGTPTLTLNDGAIATYTGGSGSSALTFKYTVGAGQNTSALGVTAFNLNGATVTNISTIVGGGGGSLTDASGNIWSFGASLGGGSYAILKNGVQFGGGIGTTLELANGVVWQENSAGTWFVATPTGWTAVYGSGPSTTVDFSEATAPLAGPLQINTASGPMISSVVESNSSSVLIAGNTLTLTLNMSEAVTVNTNGGAPTLTLNDGATATYVGGSGSNALVFSYTVAAGQNTAALAATALNLNGATMKDAAGNAASRR
jgi:large repetitive protein